MPVLNALVALLEQSYMVTVSDIAERTGLDLAEVAKALDALDPTYVDFRKTETGGDPRFWYVLKVTPEARQAVGQWPKASSTFSPRPSGTRPRTRTTRNGTTSSARRRDSWRAAFATLPSRSRWRSPARPAPRRPAPGPRRAARDDRLSPPEPAAAR